MKARELLQQAADQGNANAQINLGYLYYNGLSVSVNYEQAARYYRMAADQNDPIALNTLASLYETGQGVARDRDEAVRLYRLAAAQGNEPAAAALERLGVSRQDGPVVR